MFRVTKIFLFTISLSYLATGSFYAMAQSISKVSKTKHKKSAITTIGFRSGRELLFNSTPLIHNKQSKVHPGTSNSLFMRKALNAHIKMECGISYSVIQNASSFNINDRTVGNKYYAITQKAYNLALPVTVNYFFLPGHCCMHPYVGAGFQYNLNLTDGSNTISPFSGDYRASTVNQQTGTKYISIRFTEGITFQVNTKIQINQSFHFIPDNNNKVIGVDLGFGYQLP